MDIENQLMSLEPSKKLKGLRVKQDSYWWWHHNRTSRKWYVDKNLGGRFLNPRSSFSAFTVAELIETLPGTISMTGNFPYFLKIEKIEDTINNKRYRVAYCCMEVNSDDLCCVEDNKLADALAEIRIYLIENKLI